MHYTSNDPSVGKATLFAIGNMAESDIWAYYNGKKWERQRGPPIHFPLYLTAGGQCCYIFCWEELRASFVALCPSPFLCISTKKALGLKNTCLLSSL